MKNTSLLFALIFISLIGLYSFSESASNQEEVEIEEEIIEEVVSVINLGNCEGLVGSWTVDAASAGIQLDLSFGEDGSFTPLMGTEQAEGQWEVVDDELISIVSTLTEGQKMNISELTEESMSLT
jgi:hypothetical protein